jgi:hypothetical protein
MVCPGFEALFASSEKPCFSGFLVPVRLCLLCRSEWSVIQLAKELVAATSCYTANGIVAHVALRLLRPWLICCNGGDPTGQV